MKKLLIMAVAACCLAACNKELGPEYKVAPGIANVSCSPGRDEVHAGDDVRVTATVTSEYGFTGISILRALNDDETKVKEEGAWLSTNKTDTEKRYSGTIGKEKAGTKVTFQILAVSAYGVYTFSEVYEYTVQEETDPEPMPNPEAN